MLTREDIEAYAKETGAPDSEAAILARFASEGNQLEISIFTLSGRPLAVADIICAMAHFTTGLIGEKVQGNMPAPWSPRDERPLAPTSPPAPAAARYWGEDAESQRKETEGPGRGNPPPAN